MTGIQPFGGMVVQQHVADDVVSPAYDALTVAQRQKFRADHPHSYLHVTRSAADEADAATVSNTTLVTRGRSALERLLEANLFISHGDPALYVYRLVDGAQVQHGLVCEIPPDYYHGVARPHEATQTARADLLAEHFTTVGAASSPIACAVRDDGSLDRELRAATDSAPIVDITGSDGLQQTVWRVDDEQAQRVITELLQDEPLFIIDGHHRSAANERLFERGTVLPILASIFPEQSLRLVGFHRLVRLDSEVDHRVLLRQLQRRFRVETVSDVTAVAAGQVAVVLDGEWHVIYFDERPVAGGPQILLGSLDPVVVERELLLGIFARYGTLEIAYTPDTEPFAVIVEEAHANRQIPIFVAPVAISDMMAVADGGEIMPAKSTYFTPKVRSGLFLRLFNELLGQNGETVSAL